MCPEKHAGLSSDPRRWVVLVAALFCAAPLSPGTEQKLSAVEPQRFYEYTLLRPVSADGGAFGGAELVLVPSREYVWRSGRVAGGFEAAFVASVPSDNEVLATDCSIVPWLSIVEVDEPAAEQDATLADPVGDQR